jgi:hypothetical protein
LSDKYTKNNSQNQHKYLIIRRLFKWRFENYFNAFALSLPLTALPGSTKKDIFAKIAPVVQWIELWFPVPSI